MTAVLAAAVLAGSAYTRAADQPVRVLIFSGQNNHDWKTTTPKLKAILADSGRFTADVTDHLEQSTAETLANFDLILSDWNAWGDAKVKSWPAATREAFLNFIRSGKGYVSIHAGSSSFYDWPEYQQIGGLFWNLPATSHGAPHEFAVQFTGDHPVTRGLPQFKTKDELWLKPGVHPAAQVLATGDGQTLAVATSLGQGRGFALLLGHSADFMGTPGFQTLLLRGAEWAATGKVTIRGVGDAAALDPDEVIRRVAAYRFGDDRKAVLALEQLVFAPSTDATVKQALAAKLASALSREATPEGKRCFCQDLSVIGSVAEVPVLAKALSDTNLFFHARQALERIPAEEAAAALQSAVATSSGSARAGLINSLAAKRAEQALPDIARYVIDPDRDVAGAALEALGQIGGAQAAAALQSAEGQIAPELRERLALAILNCAESLRQSGRTAEAAALFAKLVAPGQPAQVRVAAFPSHVAGLGDRGSGAVIEALTGDDKVMQKAAIRALSASRQLALLRAAAEQLEKLPAGLQESIVVLCGECGDATVLPMLMRAADSPDASVKRAAITAIGLLGDASVVPRLVQLIEPVSDDEQKVRSEALSRLRGAGVDAALVVALQSSPPPSQRAIISALAARGTRAAVPALLQAAGSGDAIVRREAISALGKLADAGACERMIQLLDQAWESERSSLESALLAICRRDNAAIPAVAAALPKAAPSSQVILLGVLAATGGSPACAAVRRALKSDHAEVRLAAVRVLVGWEDAEPLDDLATVVETTSDAKVRALAAQGLNRMAPQAPDRAMRAAEALAVALAATTDAAEQRNFLTALIGIPSVPSLKATRAQLKNPTLAGDAAAGLVRIAEVIYPWHKAEVRAALTELKLANPPPALVQRAAALDTKLDKPANLAIGGRASSPDGVEKDGAAGGDQAAIDGDPETYWDEQDNQKLYILRVQLRERSTVGCLRILGYQHHNFAPKDFEVRGDDQLVKTVRGATYENNLLSVEFPPVQCNAVELKITGYYGPSPAIRELEIYEQPADSAGVSSSPAQAALRWERTETSLALMNGPKIIWRLNHDRQQGKPYFHPLCLADGTELTALRPADHVWHRALWFSWKFVNGLNYWEEDPKTGQSEGQTEILGVRSVANPDWSATVELDIAYHPLQQAPVLKETRLLKISAPDPTGSYRIDWTSTFTPADKDVILGRTPIPGQPGGVGYGGYAGLSIRMAAATRQWTFRNSQWATGESALHGKPARWVDYAGPTAANGEGGVAILDHPANLRHPSPWYVNQGMPYFSPALLFNEPFTLAAGSSLVLRYRILAHTGALKPADLEKEWESFAKQ